MKNTQVEYAIKSINTEEVAVVEYTPVTPKYSEGSLQEFINSGVQECSKGYTVLEFLGQKAIFKLEDIMIARELLKSIEHGIIPKKKLEQLMLYTKQKRS